MARGSVRFSALFVAALAAGGMGVVTARWLDPSTNAHRRLLQLVAGTRPITPCWSGALSTAAAPPWAPGTALSTKELRQSRALTALIEAEAAERPDAARLHALGMTCLLYGSSSPVRLNRAILALGQSAALAPERAEIWNDLAAALFVRAETRQRPEDLLESLGAADTALALDETSTAALFNRSLALEALGLFPEARRSWENLLDLSPPEPWGSEARDHLRRLVSRTGAPYLNRTRLPAGVQESLDRARRLADRRQIEAAEALLSELERQFPPSVEPFVHARVLGRQGGLAAAQRQFDRALDCYVRAQKVYERSGHPEEALYLGVLVAETASLLHEARLTWDSLHPAWMSADRWHDPLRRQTLYAQSAESARRFGFFKPAHYFQRRAVELARALEDPGLLAEAVTGRGSSGPGSAAEREEKTRQLELARALWLRLPSDDPRRTPSLTELRLAEARLATPGEEEVAIRNLSGAIADLERGQLRALLADALSARAALLEKHGRPRAAGNDLERAVEVLEDGSRHIASEGTRSSYAEGARTTFEAMIRYQLEVRRDPEAAFAYAERAHRHEILTARLYETSQAVPSLAALERRLPPTEASLAYFVLPDRLLVWGIRPGSSFFREHRIKSEELADQIDRLREALIEPSFAGLRAVWSKRLLAAVWPLPEGFLAGVERIWIVPDGPLYRLPFGALWDQRDGRFLLERQAFAKIPTVAALLGPAAPSRLLERSDQRLCAVGNPHFRREHFPALSLLPAAEEEARSAARSFPGAILLTGAEATPTRVLAALDHCDFFHFSGHSIANFENPALSQLVLSPDAAGSSGALYGKDLETLELARLRLVVLSACSTAAGRSNFFGLARPFLAAGVPTVVGSLWDVEDADTQRFFRLFYQELQRGASDPISALNLAQKKSLSWPSNTTATWATFEVYVVSTDLHHR